MADPSTGGRLRPARRREVVLAEVLAGRGDVAALAEQLDVSVATVRRDLQRLSAAGLATRTYGGAVGRPRPVELTLRQKEISYRRQKEDIAAYAAGLVADGEVLIVDAGSTAGALARHLRGRRGLTVVTNGVTSLLTLSQEEEVELVVLGGRLRQTSQAIIGPIAEESLRHVVADKAFLGADGLMAERGINCPSLEQASVKALMAAQAREVYVLADHSKLGEAPFPYFAPLRSPTTVVTDREAPVAAVAALERDPHLRVRIAPPATGSGGRPGVPEALTGDRRRSPHREVRGAP
jgi:DeoR family fructose operon transcriptional repressor